MKLIELTEAHIDQIFKNAVRGAFCEIVMDNKMAEILGRRHDGGAVFMKRVEREALKEWRKLGRPCKPDEVRS